MNDGPTVAVIGLGYIGLPTAAVLAHRGWQVEGVDVNPDVVETVNQGEVHISEPDLDAMVRSAVESGRFQAHTAPVPADVHMICVPTPFHPDTEPPQPNVEYVRAAALAIAGVLAPGNLVVIESTCPVGTTELIRDELRAAGAPVGEISVAYCPERVLPGRILAELITNDRVVGGVDVASSDAAERFYASFVEGAILTTDSRTAEMVKLVENSFRDVNIAFANEVSMLCSEDGIDAWELIRLANRHPRVNILQPGPGVGGHCIAVDPWFIVADRPELARLIRTAREVNVAKTDWVVEQVMRAADELGLDRPARVACLGLAYKPNIDDLRESPALDVARRLAAAGMQVLACEPNVTSHPEFELLDPRTAVERADLVALLVAHREFAALELTGTPVLDFCGALPAAAIPPREAVGRGAAAG